MQLSPLSSIPSQYVDQFWLLGLPAICNIATCHFADDQTYQVMGSWDPTGGNLEPAGMDETPRYMTHLSTVVADPENV